MIKPIFFLAILFGYASLSAQNIEQSYKDFELQKPVKSIEVYQARFDKDNPMPIGNTLDSIINHPNIKWVFEQKATFNTQYLLSKKMDYSSGDKLFITYQNVYNDDHLLLTTKVEKSEYQNHLFQPHFETHFKREKDTLLKETKFINNDTVYREKFVLKNNLILEEYRHTDNSLFVKNIYNDKSHIVSGVRYLSDGTALQWENILEYYENGNIKKEVYSHGLNQSKVTMYNENGLLKSETFNDEVTTYDYKYDQEGQWIYKIVHKNNMPKALYKRVLYY